MRKLTRSQGEILDFVRDYTNRNGYTPMIVDIRERFGMEHHTSKPYEVIKALKAKGLLPEGIQGYNPMTRVKNGAVKVRQVREVEPVSKVATGIKVIFNWLSDNYNDDKKIEGLVGVINLIK